MIMVWGIEYQKYQKYRTIIGNGGKGSHLNIIYKCIIWGRQSPEGRYWGDKCATFQVPDMWLYLSKVWPLLLPLLASSWEWECDYWGVCYPSQPCQQYCKGEEVVDFRTVSSAVVTIRSCDLSTVFQDPLYLVFCKVTLCWVYLKMCIWVFGCVF